MFGDSLFLVEVCLMDFEDEGLSGTRDCVRAFLKVLILFIDVLSVMIVVLNYAQ